MASISLESFESESPLVGLWRAHQEVMTSIVPWTSGINLHGNTVVHSVGAGIPERQAAAISKACGEEVGYLQDLELSDVLGMNDANGQPIASGAAKGLLRQA